MAPGKPAAFYLSPMFNGRRVISVDLHDSAFDAVFKYAMATAPDRSAQDAIRELILQAISADEEDASKRAARVQAYRETRREITQRVADFLRTLAHELEVEGVAGEIAGLPAQNYLAAEIVEEREQEQAQNRLNDLLGIPPEPLEAA